MNSLSPTDRCELYRQIRVVLVRHFIDIGRLSIHIAPAKVRLHGVLTRLPGVDSKLTPQVVDSIINEIRHIRGVHRVLADFENWRQIGAGGWMEIVRKDIGTGRGASTEGTSSADPTSRTYEIDRGST